MTTATRATLATSISTLINDNNDGEISASDVRSILTDIKDSCFNTTDDGFAQITTGLTTTNTAIAKFNGTAGQIQNSGVLIDGSNNITTGGNVLVSNGKAIYTDTTTAHTALFQAYDVDGTAYKTFATLTNANVPSFAIAAPSGGTVTIDGASIGSVTPLDGAFTTLAASGNVAINTSKFNITAASGNTTCAGTFTAAGNIVAGASGTAATLKSFPATASKGGLVLAAVNNTGDTLTTISNAAMGQASVISIPDPGASTDTFVLAATAQTLTKKTLTDAIHTNTKVCSSQLDMASGGTGTTLTNIPGLSVAVTAAGTYVFEAFLTGTSTANGGVKVAIANSGTTTSCAYTGIQYNNATTNAHTTTTTIGNAVGAATTVMTDMLIKGVIIVNAAGNLTVQAAQNASHADTTSIYVGSYLRVTRVA